MHKIFYERDVYIDFESSEKIVLVHKLRIEMNQFFEHRQGRCVTEIYDFMTALAPASTCEEPTNSVEPGPMDRPVNSPQLQLKDPVANSVEFFLHHLRAGVRV